VTDIGGRAALRTVAYPFHLVRNMGRLLPAAAVPSQVSALCFPIC
jgi:hypothetical protein